MISRVRSTVGAVLLAGVTAITGAPFTSATHAQEATVDPSIRFALPSPEDLVSDARRVVVDTPDAPTEQDDLTPVIEGAGQRVAALAPEDWEVAALAATLPDVDAAFALVRDGIGFDAYRGLLRGAQGTLSARAGNAFDRAALLDALLDAQGATTRYAFGTLGRDAAEALVARSFETPATPLVGAGHVFGDAFETAVEIRARRDHGLLAGAVADRMADLVADATELAITDVTSHTWVQVEQPDGSWLDLDPSMPDARPGDILTPVHATADAPPASEAHTIAVRVFAEHLVGSDLGDSTVLDVTLPAAAAADQRIILTFTEPGQGGGGLLDPGGLFGGGGGGATAWAPTLLVDHNAWDGDPILFSGEMGGGGLLGGSEQADLSRLAVELTVASPGREPQVIRQTLADRLSPEQRAAGAVTADQLAPVADDEGTPAIFRSSVHLVVSTGGTSPRAYAQDLGYAAAMTAWGGSATDTDDLTLNEALMPEAIADQALVIASEQRFIPAIDDTSVRAFVAAPRLTLVTRTMDLDDVERMSVVTDLAIDAVRTVAADGAAADAAARQLWYGALEGAAEMEYVLANASALEADGRVIEGVSLDMGQPLTVVTSGDAPRPEAATDDLAALLDAGGLAVVPGDVVTAHAWWELSADATTRSVLAPRLGGGRVGGSRRPTLPVRNPDKPPVAPPDKPRDQRKQKDDGKNGNEYGTLVNKVADKVEKGARAAGRVVRDGWDVVKKPLIKLK